MRSLAIGWRANSVMLTIALVAIPAIATAQQAAPPPPPAGYPPPQGAYYPPPGTYAYPPPPYQQPPPAGAYEHDGFYLRLHFGIGYLRVTGGLDKQERYEGQSGTLGIAAGGMVTRNIALFGTFVASIADSPSYTLNGTDLGTVPGSAGLFGLGGGIVYYVEGANVYLYGAAAGVQLDLSDANDNTVYETKFGLGFQLGVGKEWWVSDNWGLGVAGELVGASMPDKNDSSVKWTGGSFSVLLSATYN